MSESIYISLLYRFYFPSMDLIDDPEESNLTAIFEIPGIKTNDIKLHIMDGHLVVLGERRCSYNATQLSEASANNSSGENSIPTPKANIPIQELRFGSFRRSIRVPDGLKVTFTFYPPCTPFFISYYLAPS